MDTNTERSPRDEILFYDARNNLNAVRKGKWKLVLSHTWSSYDTLPSNDGVKGKKISKTIDSPELYNLMRDPGERYNVIEQHPERVKELMKSVEAARMELGDMNLNMIGGTGTREVGRK